MNLILSAFFLVLSVAFTWVFCLVAQGTRLMDKPNSRSMHSRPTLRGGGLVFIGLALLSLPVLYCLTHTSFFDLAIFMLCIFLIATIGFLDDLYQLSIKPRFFVQCLVALLLAVFMRPNQLGFGFVTVSSSIFIFPFVFFTVIWAINHFNFMDGIDGFCAAQAIFLFSAYAFLLGMHDSLFYQSFCFIFIAVLIGFLIFNFPPARLFMGDVGSATLGLVTFGIALIAQKKFQIPILYWFMLNGLFLFDSTFTLLRRIIHKEKWSAPHKKHAYQRLRQGGVRVSMILLGQMLINSAFLILVLLIYYRMLHWSFLLLQLSFMVLIYYLIEKKIPMFSVELTH